MQSLWYGMIWAGDMREYNMVMNCNLYHDVIDDGSAFGGRRRPRGGVRDEKRPDSNLLYSR